MIAPRNSLILLVAALGSVAGLVAALLPVSGPALLATILLLAVAIAWDARQASLAARGLRVTALPLVRAVRDRKTEILLHISNIGIGLVRNIRVAAEVPEVFRMAEPALDCGPVLRPGQGIQVTARFGCQRRGEYKITRCWFESISRMGLWTVRTAASCDVTVRVYPDISRDKTAAEFLQRGRAGARVMQVTGKGREFSQLREYLPDDPYEDVDWKSTARRGTPVVRCWRVERDQEVYVVVDASRLSARPAGAETILERYVHSALVMAIAAQAQGDRFGLITFSDRVHRFVRARSGKQHFNYCRDAIYRLQPRAVEPDFGELFAFLETRLTRRALVIILTSLDDPLTGETFARHVGIASRRHLVLAGMPEPDGARPLFSAAAGNAHQMYSALAGHVRWRQLAELSNSCRRQGVRLHLLDPARVSGQLAGIYLDVKRRQRL